MAGFRGRGPACLASVATRGCCSSLLLRVNDIIATAKARIGERSTTPSESDVHLGAG